MKLLRDTSLLFLRSMRATWRSPAWVIIGIFQPICYMLLYAPLFNRLTRVPGFPQGNALQVFTPGVLVMLGMFSATFVGYDLIFELRAGVIERLRVTPVSRLALLLGPTLRDVMSLLVQSLLLVLVAWLLGLRASVAGLLLILGLQILMGLLMASCSYALALTIKDVNAMASIIQTFILPVMLLSGIILPMELAPPIIHDIADANPFFYAVEAARALFHGAIADAAVWHGFAIMALIALLAMFWAARSFRQAVA
jgi:ABC-2 type transport system permease protein